MEKVKSFEELKQILEGYKYSSVERDGKDFEFSFATEDEVLEKGFDIVCKDFGMTEHSQNDLLKAMGIPPGFFKKLDYTRKKDVFEYIREFSEVDDKPFVGKVRSDKLYALLPPKRAGIENLLLINEIQNTPHFNDFSEFRVEVTDNTFDLRCITSEMLDKGDIAPGIHIKNSETGDRQTQVLPVVWRLACLNGLITVQKALSDGYKLPKFSDYGRLHEDLPDVIVMALKEAFNSGGRLVSLKSKIFEAPEEYIMKMAKEYQIGKYKDIVVNNLFSSTEKEYANTGYGIVNAFTATARDVDNINERLRLEGISNLIAKRIGRNKEKAIA